jgi:thioredoxin-like negative regulator of GroEL
MVARGWSLFLSGSVQQGLGLLRDAHQARPGDPRIAYRYAALLAESGDRRGAVEVLERVDPRERDAAVVEATKLLGVLREGS